MKWKINQRNYANVMDKVNRFLQKPTVEYLGIVPTVVGNQEIDVCGRTIVVPKYEDLPQSVPYLNGSCYVHPMWKDKTRSFSKGYKAPILAIASNLDSHCLPLQEGSIVEINSTRMVVTVVDNNLNLTPSIHTFINSDITNTAIIARQIDRLKNQYSDYIYDCDFDLDDGYDNFINKSILRDLVDMFINRAFAAIDEAVDNVAKFTITHEDICEEIDFYPERKLETPIECEINFKGFAESGKFEEVYVVNGEEKNNMVSVCYNLFYSLYQIEDEDEDDDEDEDVANGTYYD